MIDGIPLDIPRKQGKEIHHWAARMSEGGVWIELAWDNPQRIRQVQLTWDTGFQRRLMLSGSDEVTRTTVRAPQPETVRDYTISLRRPGSQELTPVVKVEGNYQRLNRHSIEPVEAAALRIHITATNGDDLARLLAVRCYA